MILGLTPQSLACVDVQPSEIPTLLNRLEQEYDLYVQMLASQETVTNAKQAESSCQSILRNDAQNPEALQGLEDARLNLIFAQNSAIQLRQELISTVLEDLSDPSMTEQVFYVSGVFQTLPAPYRLAVDSYDDAKQLAWAVGKRTQAESSNTSTTSAATQILNSAESQYDVNTGLIRVQQFELGNSSAIDQWVLSH